MSKKLELAGERFGRLKVIKNAGTDKNGKTIWECQCDCGNHTFSLGSNLMSGKSLSCGCLKNEKASKRLEKHGMSKTKIYRKWQGMKQRCYDEKCRSYKDYGGRGIIVCQEWPGESGFNNFYKWALGNGYINGLTIERKDVNGDYCPENCCWIPLSEQARNKTITKRTITSELAIDVARKNVVPPSTMYGRMRKGMSAEDSSSNKNFRKKKVRKIDIETGNTIRIYNSVREAARELNKSCSDISLCANGKLNKAYGYVWEFDYEE